MLKQILARAMRRHYHWRSFGFTELSELYVSGMLHTLALSILMVFVPFYLYQQGYTVAQIFTVFGFFFLIRVGLDTVAGYTVARFGPKHTLIVSSFLQIISSAAFVSVPIFHWPTWLLGAFWGASASFFFVAYHVAFSKVKHTEHAGKELGYMAIVDKIGGIVGPLLGGLAGTFLGSQYIFLIASGVLLASLWPLFRTSEPVKTRQKLNFRDLPVNKIKYDLASYSALGVENTLCINLWPLYVSLFALSGSVYVQLGSLTAIAVVVSLFTAYVIGRMVDTKNGRLILRIGAVSNAFVYVLRPFVGSYTGALATNVANEIVTTSYRLPFFKGYYGSADELPGFRIAYIVSMETVGSIAKATAWFMLAILATVLSAKHVLIVGFGLSGIASLLITIEKFKVLMPKAYNKA